MSCSSTANLIGRVAGRVGIPWLSSQSGYSGDAAQVSFFDAQPAAKKPTGARPKQKTSAPKRRARKTEAEQVDGQVSFFAAGQSDANRKQPDPKTTSGQSLPTQRQIKLTNEFSPEALQTLSVQLRLGAAAVSRQIRALNRNASRGIGHSDPRPLDWARSDKKNYRFLIEQLDNARQGRGYLDTGRLSQAELADLGEFARFEADRALRNIDHLQAGLSHLKGPTADYLTERHRLDARFYSFLAGQVETMIPPEKIEAAQAGE